MRRPHDGAVGLKEGGGFARESRQHPVDTEQRLKALLLLQLQQRGVAARVSVVRESAKYGQVEAFSRVHLQQY